MGSLFVNGELVTGEQVVETARARLAVRAEQVVREPLVVVEDADLEEEDCDDAFESQTEECPSCEEEVTVSVEIQQLRSADEAGTRLYRGACGCTWREDD